MNETWMPIPGFEFYEVSDLGRVRSYARHGTSLERAKQPRILAPCRHSSGYTQVALGRSSGTRRIHQLVMLAFVGDPCGMEVDHIDGNRTNNRLENLRYVSHADNMKLQRERKPLCQRGHAYAEFAFWDRRGRRTCLECRRIRERRRTRRNIQAVEQ